MHKKRIRQVEAKPGELRAAWGRPDLGEPADIVYAWGGCGSCGADGSVLSWFFEVANGDLGRTLRQELEARGYDITTLKFSVQIKKDCEE